MNVAIACRLHEPFINQRNFVSILSELDGFTTHIITESRNYSDINIDQNMIYHYPPITYPNPGLLMRINPFEKIRFSRLLDRLKIDILIILGISSLRFLPTTTDFSSSILLKQGGEVRLAQTGEGLSWLEWKAYRLLFRELLHHVDEVWSTELNREALETCGMPSESLRNFEYMPVDMTEFNPSGEKIDYVNDTNTTVFGTFRRIRQSNLLPSYETLLDSFYKLQNEQDDVYFVIGGFYENKNNEIKNKLQEKISDLGLNNKISTYSIVDQQSFPKYLRGLDVYVNTVHQNENLGIGSTSKQAMACGCAFVTMAQYHDYIISNNKNGIIVDGNADQLHNEFNKLCNENFQRDLKKAAHETAVNEFSIESVNDRINTIFNSLVQSDSS